MAGDLYISGNQLVNDQGEEVDLTIDGDLTVTGLASFGPASSTEVAYSKLTADTAATASGTGFGMTAIPGLSIVVPSIGVPCHIWGIGGISHSVTGTLGVGIALTGSTIITSWIGAANVLIATATSQIATFNIHGRLPANSPGTYQVFVNASSAGNFTSRSQAFSPTELFAIST